MIQDKGTSINMTKVLEFVGPERIARATYQLSELPQTTSVFLLRFGIVARGIGRHLASAFESGFHDPLRARMLRGVGRRLASRHGGWGNRIMGSTTD